MDIVEGFHDLGISVHMDDFGSGYSSLGMLKDVNVDVLKLDMKLLDAIDAQSRKARSILEAIIGMANLLALRCPEIPAANDGAPILQQDLAAHALQDARRSLHVGQMRHVRERHRAAAQPPTPP